VPSATAAFGAVPSATAAFGAAALVATRPTAAAGPPPGRSSTFLPLRHAPEGDSC